MKFTVSSKPLSELLSSASLHTCKLSSNQSISDFFLLKAENNLISVSASSPSSSFVGSLPAEVAEDGQICVIFDKLQALVSQVAQMDNATLEFSTKDNTISIVNTSCKLKGSLKTRKGEEFPDIELCLEEDWGKIEAVPFVTALQHVSPIVERSKDTSVVKSVVHVEHGVKHNDSTKEDEYILTFVATDGRALGTESYITSEGKNIPHSAPFNILNSSIPKIINILTNNIDPADISKTVDIAVRNGKLFIRNGLQIASFELIDATYPNWKRVIPVDSPSSPITWIEADAKSLYKSLTLVDITSDIKYHKTELSICDKSLSLSSVNQDKGWIEQTFDFKNENDKIIEPITLYFNNNILRACLKELTETKKNGEAKIKLGITTKTGPTIFRRLDNSGALYVVMPMNGNSK